MITTAKITAYNGEELTVKPICQIDRELLQKQVGDIEIRLNDGRSISAIQRKKIFAIIKDISEWSGHISEELRHLLTWDYVGQADVNYFSLSNVDMTTARDFINFLIRFCFEHGVPTKRPLIDMAEEIGKYLYYCLEFRKCAICNEKAYTHHVTGSHVGMGRNRDEICHIGMKAIALCTKHHDEAHRREKALFEENHIYGIALDEYLVKKLKIGRITQGGAEKGEE